ncbi:MAG: phosphatidylglycerophosphate synthase [Candidatus Aldehydirespiratoraceae bacterium]
MNDRMTRLWSTKTRDDEWWSSFVTAPLAVLFNYVVVDIRWLTPNLITVASFVSAVVAAGFVVVGGATNFVLAALLIHLSHVFDCMDGQLARYRQTMSAAGSYYDRATDQIQVAMWFGAVAYAAYDQSGRVLPVFLAFAGVSFYSLRGYTKYVEIHVEMSRDKNYLERIASEKFAARAGQPEGRASGLSSGVWWFIGEQRKILHFDEGVFIFMLSLALVLNQLTPMLWIFALSQVSIGASRAWQRGRNIELARHVELTK